MQTKLFVAGFPYALSEQELTDAFAQAGTVVSAKIIVDRETNRSRGFGFVEMSTDEETEEAIRILDGQDLNGRRLNVSIARPIEKRPYDDNRRDYGSRRDSGDFGNKREY